MQKISILSQIPLVYDLPGVGQNYQDHADSAVSSVIHNTDVITRGDTLNNAGNNITIMR